MKVKLKRKHRGIYLISHDGINISISNPKVCNYGLGSNAWQLLIEYTDTAEPLYNWWFKKKADAVKEAIKWMDNYSNHI
jgi:hypothetical protein